MEANLTMRTLQRRIETQRKRIKLYLISFFFVITAYLSLLLFANPFVVFAQENSETSLFLTNTYIYDLTVTKRDFLPRTITIRNSNSQTKYLVYSIYSKDILNEVGFELKENMEILPGLDIAIPSNGVISVIEVEEKVKTITESLPFTTFTKEDPELPEGEIQIESEGEKGLIVKSYKQVFRNHTLYTEELIEIKTLKEPKSKIVINGTKSMSIQDCNYWGEVVDKYAPKSEDRTKNRWMKYIMLAETNCDAGQNTRNTYFGLYQFLRSTFKNNGGNDIYNGEDQIKVVSKMYDACQQGQWGPYRNTTPTVQSFKSAYPDLYAEIEKSCGR